MKKKLTVLFLTIIFILCIGTVFVSATNASDETPTLSIAGFSLSLKESIFINCKVSHNNLDAEYVDDIQILVWEEVPEAYTANNNPSAVLSWLGTDNSGYESYRYTNITAKEMTKELYFCAYVKVGDTEFYSAPKKYSILTYAYNKINATSPNAKLVKLCQDLLDYGASAQTYLGYNTDFLANDEVYKITVSGGTLADGFTSGIYQNGDSVVLTANTPEDGYAFSHWENSNGETVSEDTIFETSVSKVETYITVYDKEYSEGLAYTLSDDGTYYSVNGIGTCTDTDVIIPGTHYGLPVKKISSFAFHRCSNIKNITIRDGIEHIGNNAFYFCENLETVTMTNSVVQLDSSAFSYCTNLTNLKLSNNISSIGKRAFDHCEKLSTIQLPSVITTIEEATFLGCIELKTLDIPKGVTYIGNSAFSSCESITELVIPNGIVELGTYVFNRTYNLENLTLPDTLQIVGEGAFESCGVKNIFFLVMSQNGVKYNFPQTARVFRQM